ncbi:MAG: TonB-dependent receptor [Pseudomonadota bacterium]
MKRIHRTLALAGFLPVVPLTALAQMAQLDNAGKGTLETVVITATRRAQAMQDVPQTLSVFSEKNLKDIGAQDFATLVNSMAGVELRQEQSGQGGVAVRGISELNMMNLYGGTGSATGMYVDEMPLSAGGRFPGLSAFDIQRVEVLKGPQGTLFGEGSLAGTVRFIAQKPKFDKVAAAAEVVASKTEGGGDNHAVNVMLNVPLSGNAGMRIVAFEREDGGYMNARITDGKTVFATLPDANAQRSKGGRLLLRALPSDDLSISAMLLLNEARNGTRSRGPQADVGSFSVPENQHDKLNALNLTLEYETGIGSVVASVSHTDRKITADTDQAQSLETVNGALAKLRPLAVNVLGVPWPAAATGVHSLHNYDARADTLELRLVSNAEGSLKWTLGAFYKDTDTLHAAEANSFAPVPGASWQAVTSALTKGAIVIREPQKVRAVSSIKQTALFGEVSKDFSPRLQLLAGGRLFKEKRNSKSTWESAFAFLSGGLPPGQSETGATSSLFNPKVTASYKWSPDVMGYATHSKGFRSGGQNEYLPFTPTAAPDYKPETLTNNELGLKTNLFGNTVSFNVSAYRMKWNDLQQVVAQGIGGVGKALGNVGSATSNGLDVDVKWMPTRRLDVSFSASLLKAELDNAVVLEPSAGGVTVPAGTAIPGTSKVSVSLGSSYRAPLSEGLAGFVGGRIAHRGEAISDLRHYQNTTPGSTVLDLRFGIETKRWQLYGFIDNATDRKVAVREDFDGPDVYTQQRNFFWARPRTIGFNLRTSF